MAGETPSGDRHAAARAQQRKLSTFEQLGPESRSTDKYYKSGDISAVASSPADAAVPTGGLKQNNYDRLGPESRSTDKYYASVPEGAPAPLNSLVRHSVGAVHSADPTAAILVDSTDRVKALRQAILTKLSVGEDQIEVHASPEFLNAARVALELAVTQGAITEEQLNDITLKKALPNAAPADSVQATVDALLAKLSPPAPKGDAVADAPIDSVDDFLAADDEAPAVSTEPQDVHPVEVKEDGSEVPVPADGEDDEDYEDGDMFTPAPGDKPN